MLHVEGGEIVRFLSCVSSAVADTAPYRPRHHCPLRPMPDILHPAATATLCCFCSHFSAVLLLLCPVSLYFFRLTAPPFPFPHVSSWLFRAAGDKDS